MRNLFIGERSLQNDAILEIIQSEINEELYHILPEKLEQDIAEILDGNYNFVIIDLVSAPVESSRYLHKIKQSNGSAKIIGISDSNSNFSLNGQGNQEPGLDYCFSLDADSNEFLQIISKFNKA